MCTRSANDAAMVVGEAIGGTEEEFAKLMTEKARALGMSNTTYVNASGLPAEEQITTARDQAILGRAIQERFPTYYRYFSTTNFRFHGHDIHNHNSLLGNVKGVDGIKTGYTEASGYNLVTSVRREARHIISVVLGGRSGAARDSRMREMIEQYISHASVQRTAPAGMDLASQRNVSAPAQSAVPAIAAPEAPTAPAESSEPLAVKANTDKTKSDPAQDSTAVEQARAQVHPAKVPKASTERSRRTRGKPAAANAPPATTASFSGPELRNSW
jgi:D-alanyl-D-alanine carboxypeptidase